MNLLVIILPEAESDLAEAKESTRIPRPMRRFWISGNGFAVYRFDEDHLFVLIKNWYFTELGDQISIFSGVQMHECGKAPKAGCLASPKAARLTSLMAKLAEHALDRLGELGARLGMVAGLA